jgi:hypothetical protein
VGGARVLSIKMLPKYVLVRSGFSWIPQIKDYAWRG